MRRDQKHSILPGIRITVPRSLSTKMPFKRQETYSSGVPTRGVKRPSGSVVRSLSSRSIFSMTVRKSNIPAGSVFRAFSLRSSWVRATRELESSAGSVDSALSSRSLNNFNGWVGGERAIAREEIKEKRGTKVCWEIVVTGRNKQTGHGRKNRRIHLFSVTCDVQFRRGRAGTRL